MRPLRAPSPRRGRAGRGRAEPRAGTGAGAGAGTVPGTSRPPRRQLLRKQPPGAGGRSMAPRVLPLPRQHSFCSPVVLNPFVHPGRLSAGDKLRVRPAVRRAGGAALPCPARPGRAGEGLPGGGRLPLPQGCAPRAAISRRGCAALRRLLEPGGESQRPPEGREGRKEKWKGSRPARTPPGL